MIQLECSNCKRMLSIDDAFAGGVCRCQHCGTIQTVPKSGKATTVAAGTTQKALFKRKARIESALSPYSDGLDKAADQMESSGSLSGLAEVHRSSTPASPGSEKLSSSSVDGVPSPRNGSAAGTAAGSVAGMPSPGGQATATMAPPAKPKGHFVPTPSKSASAPAQEQAPVSHINRKPLIIGGCAAAGIVVLVLIIVMLSGVADGTPAVKTPVEPPRTTNPLFTVTPPAAPPAAAPVAPPATPKPAPAVEITIVADPAPVAAPARAPAPGPDTTTESLQITVVEPANIFGLPLDGKSVVFVIDRSGCTKQAFQTLVDAALKAAGLMGSDHKFQIVVWNNRRDLVSPATLAEASEQNIASARQALAETSAGASSIASLLRAAVAQHPAEIVLMSAVDADQYTVNEIQSGLTGSNVKLTVIAASVGFDLMGEKLKQLTTQANGRYKQIDLNKVQ